MNCECGIEDGRALCSTVNPGEALDNDGSSSQVPRLQGGVLSAGALAIVVISHHDPGHPVGLHTIRCMHSTDQSVDLDVKVFHLL